MLHSKATLTSTVAALALGLGQGALAQDEDQTKRSMLSISGMVTSADDNDSFKLDYGDGEIEVETGDMEGFNPDTALNAGDDVIVYGRTDRDLFEGSVIEASQVYDVTTYSYFYETDDGLTEPIVLPVHFRTADDGSYAVFVGTIGEIDGREFDLETDGMAINVDTAGMRENLLDDRGTRQYNEGDRIIVSGLIDDKLFDERELTASTITSMTDTRRDAEG